VMATESGESVRSMRIISLRRTDFPVPVEYQHMRAFLGAFRVPAGPVKKTLLVTKLVSMIWSRYVGEKDRRTDLFPARTNSRTCFCSGESVISFRTVSLGPAMI
jgi:hypothetical protein